MMTSFIASPGHHHPQYCNNVIHSAYNHLKRSEGLPIESPTSTRLCLLILFRFCSYLCCLSMGDSYNFRLCFELPTECNPGAKQHYPHAFDRGAMRPKCSWLFLLFQLWHVWRLYNSYTDPLKNAIGCQSYAVSFLDISQCLWNCM